MVATLLLEGHGEMAKTKPKATVGRRMLRALVIGTLLGLTFNLPFLTVKVYHDVIRTGRILGSRMHVFKQIQIGMSYQQVHAILQKEKVRCESDDVPWHSGLGGCIFTDFWREYLIRFDQSGLVFQKSYYFRYYKHR